MAQHNRIPLSGSIELLPLCNMDCDMCYVRLSRQEMEARGQMRTGAQWLDLGRQMAEAGTLFLLLTGGEPLLHPDFREIYLGLKRMGLILTLNTNATLIDEDWADFFGKHKPRRINITLYGSDGAAYERLCHYPDGFRRVVRAVQLLRQRGVDVRLGSSITPVNAADIPQMIRVAKELDVPMRMDTYMLPATRERSRSFAEQNRLSPEEAAKARIMALRGTMGEEMFLQYRDQVLHRVDHAAAAEPVPTPVSCRAGKCSFNINWQGKMRPCVILSEPAVNVFDNDFASAWQQISSTFSEVCYCADCSACRLRPLCRVCAAAALLETGAYMGKPTYLCRYAAESERLLRQSREEDT